MSQYRKPVRTTQTLQINDNTSLYDTSMKKLTAWVIDGPNSTHLLRMILLHGILKGCCVLYLHIF